MNHHFTTYRVLNITQHILQMGLFCALLLSSARAQATCLPPPSGLVSWWPGDGNANDIISGNNGTLTNGAAFSTGQVGQAFSFTNNHAGVVVGNPANLQLTSFTIECWFRRHSSTQLSNDPSCPNGWLFGYGHNGYGFLIEQNSAGDFVLSLTQTDYNHEDGGPSITDTNWHHGAVTWSGTAAVFYLDGVSYTGSACSTPDSPCFHFSFTTPAGVGARADNLNGMNECAFNGDVDEVSVYNRVLTAEEIQAIFSAGSAGKCSETMTCTIPDLMAQVKTLNLNRGQTGLLIRELSLRDFVRRVQVLKHNGMIDSATADALIQCAEAVSPGSSQESHNLAAPR